MHAVGAARVRNAVENDVAHADLALKGLVAGLGVDEVRQPVEILFVIGFVRGLERGGVRRRQTDRLRLRIPRILVLKRRGERAHRERRGVVMRLQTFGDIEAAAVYGHIFLTGDSRQRQAPSFGS